MASATQHRVLKNEPLVRVTRRKVPNLRNPTVAEEYRRQRTLINAAAERQRKEMEFWESLQAREGWF